jgi:Ribonuclease G/E
MLKDILAIGGYSGLYKFISQGRNGIIVESFDTKQKMNAQSNAKISALEDIAIFTYEEDIELKDVFKKIYDKENGGASINHKSSAKELKSYMSEILPNYDEDRVYVSDIKKLISWYNILQKLDLLDFTKKEEETEEEPKEEPKEKK